MTQVAYSILFPELRRGRDKTYRRCELVTLTFDLEGHRDSRSYASGYFVTVPSANFAVWPITWIRHIPCDLVTLTFNLGVMSVAADAGLRHPSAHQLKFLGLTVWKIWHMLCVCVSRPVTLIFDPLTLKLMRNVARVMAYPPANFGDTTTIRFRFMGHWSNTAQTDHVTLRP